MERIGGEHRGQTSSIRQVALASFIGTTIEWYDFFLYGTAAALVFGQIFFPPNEDPLIGTLAAFATFAVGFITRPLGGVVFGHFGDRIGRKSMLVLSLLIMGIATFLVGLLPTYAQVGIWAPVLLVVLRLVQGIGIGGEWGGAVLMAVEHAPEGRRGFYGSWPQVGGAAGLLLSTSVFALFAGLPEDQFLAWGWRVPFLLSIVLVGVGLFIRLRLLESPVFIEATERAQQQRDTESRLPIMDLFRKHPKNILLAMGARLADAGFYYLFNIFVLTYATQQAGVSRGVALTGTIIAATLTLVSVPAYGALSDRVGRRPLYIFGAATCALFTFPFFWLIDSGVTALIWLAPVVAMVLFHSAMYGPQAAFFSELFGTRVRYSGASVGYQLGGMISGGFTPFIAAALLAWAGGVWPIVAYAAFLAVVSMVSVYFAEETFRGGVSEQDERDASKRTLGSETVS